jgi:hypothetical protein
MVRDLNRFYYIESQDGTIRIMRIYSEAMLDRLDAQYDFSIANHLLSRERLTRKIRQFNGYVGYVGIDNAIYYDANVEQGTLNIIR